MEVMSLEEMPWEDYHHRSSFLPPCHMVEEKFMSTVSSEIVSNPRSPTLIHGVESEGNLCNINKTIPVDILVKPGVSEIIQIGQNYSPLEVQYYTNLFKEFRDVFYLTYEEILGIDPSIFVHEIKTYPFSKPVRQNYIKYIREKQ